MGYVCSDGRLRNDDYRHGHGNARGRLELEVHVVRSVQKHILRQMRLSHHRMNSIWIMAMVTVVYLNMEKSKTFVMGGIISEDNKDRR